MGRTATPLAVKDAFVGSSPTRASIELLHEMQQLYYNIKQMTKTKRITEADLVAEPTEANLWQYQRDAIDELSGCAYTDEYSFERFDQLDLRKIMTDSKNFIVSLLVAKDQDVSRYSQFYDLIQLNSMEVNEIETELLANNIFDEAAMLPIYGRFEYNNLLRVFCKKLWLGMLMVAHNARLSEGSHLQLPGGPVVDIRRVSAYFDNPYAILMEGYKLELSYCQAIALYLANPAIAVIGAWESLKMKQEEITTS